MDGNRYFLLNREEDLIQQETCFCSRLLDSGEKQTVWSRIKLSWEVSALEEQRLFVFCSETDFLVWQGKKYDIKSLLAAKELPIKEKRFMFSVCETLVIENTADALLDQLKGRYLWFVLERETADEKMPMEIQIFFQADSWLSFLPEIYKEKDKEQSFLFRYLSIFQWLYFDMSEQISSMPHRLYPSHASKEFLEQMAGWFAMEDMTVWNQSQLVYLLENQRRLSGIRGTRQYMEEIIQLYTGHIPFIVEYHQTESCKSNIRIRTLLEGLYGDNPYTLTVILPEQVAVTQQEIAVLQRIIRSCAPAYMECRVVVLEPFIYLDRYAYLGINSCLGVYRTFHLDDAASLIPYAAVIGQRRINK